MKPYFLILQFNFVSLNPDFSKLSTVAMYFLLSHIKNTWRCSEITLSLWITEKVSIRICIFLKVYVLGAVQEPRYFTPVKLSELQ